MRASSGVVHGYRGFTLLEMIVVISIISTLALLVGPSVLRNVGDANVATARTQVELISVALDAYRLDTGRYPTSAEGLEALRTPPPETLGWRGPYLRRPVPDDPWSTPWIYQAPGIVNPHAFDLYSLGADQATGGSGEDADVTSWGGPVERLEEPSP